MSAQFVAHFFAKKGRKTTPRTWKLSLMGVEHTLPISKLRGSLVLVGDTSQFLSSHWTKWEKLFLEIDGDSNYINTISVETGANLETT